MNLQVRHGLGLVASPASNRICLHAMRVGWLVLADSAWSVLGHAARRGVKLDRVPPEHIQVRS
jgi:hypothetical protein